MSIPMFAAVPAMILIADSMVVQFRSGSFSAAIVLSWSIVITPTLSCFGSFDPFSTPVSTTQQMSNNAGRETKKQCRCHPSYPHIVYLYHKTYGAHGFLANLFYRLSRSSSNDQTKLVRQRGQCRKFHKTYLIYMISLPIVLVQLYN